MMTRIVALAVLLALALPVPAAQLALSEGRQKQSLAGSWHYIVDPQDVGGLSYKGTPIPNGFFHDRQVQHAAQLQEYDFRAAPTLQVPGSWTAQVDNLFHYEGVVWLQRSFNFSAGADSRRQFIQFEGVNYDAMVFVNGQSVGRHEGGFTPFSLEISDVLREGNNSLVLRVDNRTSADTLPAERYDWWNYGGITREVFLVETPETFIRNFRLQLDRDDPERAIGWVDVDGAADAVQVQIGDGPWQSFSVGGAQRVQLSMPAPGALWQPGSPVLHRVTLRYADDAISEQLGFRTVSTRGRDILVNGEKVFLRGVSLHEEKLDGSDRMATAEDAAATLQAISALGANYARLSHYPHNRHMARLADELGLLLWAEVPVYWDVGFDNPDTLDAAKQRLTELIYRDGNRASVIIWSVGNETPPGEARNQFLLDLVAHVRNEDGSRLVSAAAMSSPASLTLYAGLLAGHLQGVDADGPLEVEIDDPLAADLDILAYNEYMGWYDGPLLSPVLKISEEQVRRASLAVIPQIRFRAAADMPLVLSEFGAGAVKDRKGEALDLWTESYQAAVYRAQLAMVAQSPGVAGISPWVLKDVRSPRRPLAGVQDYYNRKGLLDEKGSPKQAYYVLRDFYTEGTR